MPAISCLCCNSFDILFWAKATDIEYFSTGEQFTYYQCQDCSCLFIHPLPNDQLNKIYPSNYYSFSKKISFTDSIKEWIDKRYFKSIFKNLRTTSIKILDVGGGEGWLLNNIIMLDTRISFTQVVDINRSAGEMAKKHGHEYFCGRIEDFTTHHKFDLVLLLNLIEHVENPHKVLTAIENMLSPNGLILVKTPNYDSLDARIFRYRNWGGYHCPRHWVLFSKESFGKLLARTNLSAIYFSYTQGAPFWMISTLYWLSKKIKRIHISKERPTYSHPLASFLNAVFALIDFARIPFSKTSQMFFLLQKLTPFPST